MNIIKYSDFIKENFNDSPEIFVENALKKIKRKIDSIFEKEENSEENQDPNKVRKISDVVKKKKESGEKLSLKELGVTLEDSQISKYSKTSDSLTLWFSDPEGTYRLYIMINLEDAVPKDNTKDFSDKDIEKAFIRFKKYDSVDEYIGEITKTVKIENIDEDFLIDLKIEIDKEYGSEEDDFSIETE